MTNYNERLDEILSKLARDTTLADRAADIATTPRAVSDANEAYQWSLGDAKQAFTSLIKELVAEAKPIKCEDYHAFNPPERVWGLGYDEAVREFEQNVLKAFSNSGKE